MLVVRHRPSRWPSRVLALRQAPLLWALLMILLVGLATSGCATLATHGPPPTATPDPLAGLSVYAPLGGFLTAHRASDGQLRWMDRYPKPSESGVSETIQLGPVVVDGVVYGSDYAGYLFAVRASDGSELWHTQLDAPLSHLLARGVWEWGPGYDTTPLLFDRGLLYVTPMATHDALGGHNDIFAVDARDGTLRWHHTLWYGSPPVVAAGVVYVGSLADGSTPSESQGYVSALDATTGVPRWRTTIAHCSTPHVAAVAHGVLYATGCDHAVVALRIGDGTQLWRSQAFVGRFFGPDNLAATDDGVYLAVQGGPLVALEPASGAVRWSVSAAVAAFSVPRVVGTRVYIGSYTHCFSAVDTATGAVIWTANPFPEDPCLEPPYPESFGGSNFTTCTLVDGVLFVAANLWWPPVAMTALPPRHEGIYALDARDGHVLWSQEAQMKGQISGAPVVAP